MKADSAARVPSDAAGKRLATCLVCLFLAAIVFAVFGQSARHEFVNYDDDQYVYENPVIRNGLSLQGIQWAFTHAHAQNWHPVTTISHMMDCQLYGLKPKGHHMTNVSLHALVAIFLFLALRQLSGAFWPSAVVAAVFAIHPLRVESVAWVSERKDVLSGVFFTLTLWAYARYARSDRPSPGRYLLVVVLFAVGLMCKPTLVTLPFLLLLLDYWPLRRFVACSTGPGISRLARIHPVGQGGDNLPTSQVLPAKSVGNLIVEKVPFLLIAAASCAATIVAQGGAVITMRQLTFGDRVANAVVSYVIYLGQVIWPANLAIVYPYPESSWNMSQILLASLVLLILSVAFAIWRGKYPYLLIGWLWFIGMLVPMIGIVQVGLQARADRYTYLSQIGLYLLLTWGAVDLFSKWRRGPQGLAAVALLVVMVLMADAVFETSFWRNSETVWKRALANTTNNYIAENNLGEVLMKKEGRLDEAILHLRKSLEISPNYPDANNNLGYTIASKGEWEKAIVFFQSAMRVRPNFPQAHSNLAVSLGKLGKTDEAIAELREALRLKEDYRDAHCNLAILLLQVGQREEATVHFREALRLKPDDEAVRTELRNLETEK